GVMRLPIDERAQRDDEENRKRLDPAERIAEPIPLLAFAQQHLPADDGEDEEAEADGIEAKRPLFRGSALLGEVIGVADEEVAESKGNRADRQIDIENPAPRVLICDPAAERGAEDGGDER